MTTRELRVLGDGFRTRHERNRRVREKQEHDDSVMRVALMVIALVVAIGLMFVAGV